MTAHPAAHHGWAAGDILAFLSTQNAIFQYGCASQTLSDAAKITRRVDQNDIDSYCDATDSRLMREIVSQ